MKYVYEFTNKRKLTKAEFIKWFQKKFLYTIRKFKMIQKGDRVGYCTTPHLLNTVHENLLKMFAEKAPIELIKLPRKEKGTLREIARRNKLDKFSMGSTSDNATDYILRSIIEWSSKDLECYGPVENLTKKSKIIRPMHLFLEKEVELYAKLKGLKYKEIKPNKDYLHKFIKELEKKHPELKHSVIKSQLELFKK